MAARFVNLDRQTPMFLPCERVMFRRDLKAAVERLLAAKTLYVLDVVTACAEHVLPFIPAARTVADTIWKVGR